VAHWQSTTRNLISAMVDGYLAASCLSCEATLATRNGFCSVCLELVGAGPPFVYRGPVAQAIQRGKYHGSPAARMALAAMFASHATVPADMPISFVPAHWTRRMWRGFDFPAELAHALGQQHRRPVVELLRATRRDPRLATLEHAADRQAVVYGRFVATPLAAATPAVVLVDDVFTTGATLQEATRVLQDRGCVVHPLTLSFAP
jgi:predicted amidophosphoribosyltransferase